MVAGTAEESMLSDVQAYSRIYRAGIGYAAVWMYTIKSKIACGGLNEKGKFWG